MKPEQLQLVADMVENTFAYLSENGWHSSDYQAGLEDFREKMLENLKEEHK